MQKKATMDDPRRLIGFVLVRFVLFAISSPVVAQLPQPASRGEGRADRGESTASGRPECLLFRCLGRARGSSHGAQGLLPSFLAAIKMHSTDAVQLQPEMCRRHGGLGRGGGDFPNLPELLDT